MCGTSPPLATWACRGHAAPGAPQAAAALLCHPGHGRPVQGHTTKHILEPTCLPPFYAPQKVVASGKSVSEVIDDVAAERGHAHTHAPGQQDWCVARVGAARGEGRSGGPRLQGTGQAAGGAGQRLQGVGMAVGLRSLLLGLQGLGRECCGQFGPRQCLMFRACRCALSHT